MAKQKILCLAIGGYNGGENEVFENWCYLCIMNSRSL